MTRAAWSGFVLCLACTPASSPPVAGHIAPLDGAYHGTLGGKEIFVRLAEAADSKVRGRYFDASDGQDVPLEGSRQGADVVLLQRRAGRPSWRIEARLVAGALVGTWRANEETRAFRVAVVPRLPLEPVLVATKRIGKRVRLEYPGTFGGTTCDVELAYPELFGLPDAGVEDALNAKLAPSVERCEDAGEHTREFSVFVNRDGILSLAIAGYDVSEGAAHPTSFGSTLNVVTKTGRELTSKDVFLPGAEQAVAAKLEPAIKAALAHTPGADATAEDELRGVLALPTDTFLLEETGVRFDAWGLLPHAFQALAAGQEFFVTFDEVRPWLAVTGDAARVWGQGHAKTAALGGR